uniref:DNA mismatch repair proteins mutS family domain-containing protein n=1 Tax=viral metagenome TaxID=1070528 RepID=A0A6C0KGI2_9ZZZZ
MTLIDYYFDETSKYTKEYGEKTVVLIECGKFFEIYGVKDKRTQVICNNKSKIEEVSKLCNLSIAFKNGDKNNIIMAGCPMSSIDKYIQLLVENGWTVPLILQDKVIKTHRSLKNVYTAGSYFNNNDTQITNNIMCVWIEVKNPSFVRTSKDMLCGISVLDIYSGKCYIHQYEINHYIHEPSSYDELEHFYTIYKPKEVHFIYDNMSEKELSEIIQFINVDSLVIKKEITAHTKLKNCQKQTYQEDILKKYYEINDYNIFIESCLLNEYEIAKQSFCYLLELLNNHNPDLIKNIYEPQMYDITNNIILGNHSLKQLNIVEDKNNTSKISSVVSFLSFYCLTIMGKREMKKNILNPCCDINHLNEQYDIIDYVKTKNDQFSYVYKELKGIVDIEKLLRKIMLGTLTPVEIANLYSNIKTLLSIYKKIKKDKTLKKYIQSHIKEDIDKQCNILMSKIDESVDISECTSQSTTLEKNIFKYGVYDKIDNVLDKYENENNKLSLFINYLNEMLCSLEKGQQKNYVYMHKTDKSGISLQLTNRRSKLLIDYIKKHPNSTFSIPSSHSNEEPTIIKLSDLKTITGTSNCKRIESEQIRTIMDNITSLNLELMNVINEYYITFLSNLIELNENLKTIILFVIKIDIVMTKAFIAKKYNYCKPCIKNAKESFFEAKDIRHLLIEHLQTDELYVPNDISLGKEDKGHLLFGTNAVGKSSLVKSIGICVILAQSGFFVPCSSFTYFPYKSIFTRILGNDNIFKGLSTFAVEMIELNTILKFSTNRSLVLGDELCSGTETISAISIFISGILDLYKKKSSFIFATHFHQVTEMEEITSLKHLKLKHMKVRFNKEIDRLEYDRKLCDGPGDSIYGLEVCKSLRMPEHFLSQAYNIRLKLLPKTDSILNNKTSKYNSLKIKGNCEVCGKEGIDVHHLQFQKNADKDGYIKTFNKDHKANLINICKKCHNEIHQNNKEFKKVKTTKGYELMELN